ncbi:MAG: ABC transporter permease [Thermoleophilia bacterium]
MSAPALAPSAPLLRLTLRSLLGGRRALALGVLALIPIVAALVYAAGDATVAREVFWARLLQRLVIPTIAAFVAVVLGSSAIADEREDGTILYLASTPLPRLSLVVTKVLAAWLACMALLVPSTIAAAVICLRDALTAEQIVWPLVGIALCTLCYSAVTCLLAMLVRRPVILGVLYILLWEGSIATFAASADRLSIAAYGRAVAVEGVVVVNAPDVSAGVAIALLLAATALATWAAARRFGRTELP